MSYIRSINVLYPGGIPFFFFFFSVFRIFFDMSFFDNQPLAGVKIAFLKILRNVY